MFKKILVPLDGSPEAERALPVAKRLLERTLDGEVTLFTVGRAPNATRRRGSQRSASVRPSPIGTVALDVLAPPAPAYAETRDQAVERREHELLDYLHQVAPSLASMGHTVRVAVRLGEPAREIIELARREQFDLIVMAMRHRSVLAETLLGKVMSKVVGSGVAPTLVVPGRRAEEDES